MKHNKKLWEIYRKESANQIHKMKRVLNYPSVCEICFCNVYGADAHHIDGDITFNKRNNILFLCKTCHRTIHNGFGFRGNHTDSRRVYDEDFEEYKQRIKALIRYREKWLNHDRNFELPPSNGLIL